MKTFLKAWGVTIAIILAIILSYFFLWSPVIVDGHSMDPTLADKERLVLIKPASIHRGDIVVAKETNGGQTKDIVKRVVGVPGDMIRFDHDKLTINGTATDEPYLANFVKQRQTGQLEKTYGAYPLTNSLTANDRDFFVQLAQNSKAFTTDSIGQTTFQYYVPNGEYYLMGDNRIISQDSRAVGTFKRSDIMGVVKFRFWPLNKISFIN
ncbi:MAG: signal peptidase I [Streptococcaceae bacterium]|nr:signal peptidase I [Streptococcaceae bacterium]MCL2858109.1 signal peptidase I [Streptococcaceae bacterium]